jgi:hypothetical protein
LKKHDLRGKLRAALRETLGAARPAPGSHNPLESAQVVLSDEELDAAIDAMVKDAKPKELNRRSFGDVLRKMCAEVGMEASDEERGRFVKIRNHLVHQGVFLESLGEPDQQCRFLDNFVGRFLLAALGYVVPIEPNGESSHDEADASAPSEHPA